MLRRYLVPILYFVDTASILGSHSVRSGHHQWAEWAGQPVQYIHRDRAPHQRRPALCPSSRRGATLSRRRRRRRRAAALVRTARCVYTRGSGRKRLHRHAGGR